MRILEALFIAEKGLLTLVLMQPRYATHLTEFVTWSDDYSAFCPIYWKIIPA